MVLQAIDEGSTPFTSTNNGIVAHLVRAGRSNSLSGSQFETGRFHQIGFPATACRGARK